MLSKTQGINGENVAELSEYYVVIVLEYNVELYTKEKLLSRFVTLACSALI